MRAAFAVAVADPGTRLPAHVRASLQSPSLPAHAGFTPVAHAHWSSEADDREVGVWQELHSEKRPSIWTEDARGFAAVTGQLRWIGHPWGPRASWPARLFDLRAPGSLPHRLDELGGIFAGVALDRNGGGVIVTDPHGLRFLYHGRGNTWTVFSSHPTIAARLTCDRDERPQLDALAVAGQAYTRFRFTHRTGFAGIEVLPTGTYVELTPHEPPRLRHRAAVWLPDDELRALTRAELLERAAVALEENLRAALAFPAQAVVVDLTGGMDSRMVLATAIAAGITDEIVFRTYGPDGLADVEIARDLAQRFGLRWLNGRDHQRFLRERTGGSIRFSDDAGTWTDRARRHVQRTAGMGNISQFPEDPTFVDYLSVKGHFGERLRSGLRYRLPDEDHLIGLLDRRVGHLRLLRPHAHEWHRRHWVGHLLDDPTGLVTLEDRHDAFVMNFYSRSGFGIRENLLREPRVAAPQLLQLTRLAFAAGPDARIDGSLVRGLLARGDPTLPELPFASGGFRDPRRPPRRAPTSPAPRDLREPPRNVRPATNVAEAVRERSGMQEQVALYRELAADRSNEGWEHIDREMFTAAVEHHRNLTKTEKAEVAGAATALLWLAECPAGR